MENLNFKLNNNFSLPTAKVKELFAHQFNETINYMPNILDIMNRTMKEAAEMLEAEVVTVVLYSDSSFKNIQFASSNVELTSEFMKIDSTNPIIKIASEKENSFLITEEKLLPKNIKSCGISTFSSILENKIFGLLIFLSKNKVFTEKDITTADLISKEIAEMLKNLDKTENTVIKYLIRKNENERYKDFFLKIGEALSYATDINQILKSLAEISVNYTGADYATVSLIENKKITRQLYAQSPEDSSEITSVIRKHSFINTINENIMFETSYKPEKNKKNGIKHYFGLPITHKNELTAIINIYSSSDYLDISDEKIEMLEATARQAGLAIENARNYEREQRRLREATVLYEAVRAVSQSTSMNELLSVTIKKLSQIAKVDCCVIFFYEKEKHQLVLTACSDSIQDIQISTLKNLKLYSDEIDPDVWEMLVRGTPYLFKHGNLPYSISMKYITRLFQPAGDSIIIPLIAREKLIGLVYLYDSTFQNHFTSYTTNLLKTMSMQISISIQRMNLHENREEQAEQLKTLLNISSILPTARSTAKVSKLITEKAFGLKRVKAAVLVLIDEETQKIEVKSKKNLPEELDSDELQIKISQLAMKTNKSIMSLEAGKIQEPELKHLLKNNTRNIISVPFISKRKCIGALNLFSDKGEIFKKNEIKLFKSFAEQATSAIKNATHEDNVKNKMKELAILFESSKFLNSSLNRNMVLETITRHLIRYTNSDAISVMLAEEQNHAFGYEKSLRIVISSGIDKSYEKKKFNINDRLIKEVICSGQHVIKEYKGENDKDFPESLLRIGLKTILAVPMEHRGKIIGILNVYRKNVSPYNEAEISLLSILANMSASAIENAEMFESQRAVANILQSIVMPRQEYNFKNADIGYKYIPSGDISGDYFDMFQLDENRFSIVIADVSGKGHSAAIYTVRVKYLLKAYALAGFSPAEILTKVNTSIIPETEDDKFITLFYLEINVKNKTLKYSSAGHEPVLLYNSKNKSREYLTTEGMIIGITDQAEFQEETKQYENGNILALYTDGITEAVNEKEEPFGTEKICEAISKNSEKPAQFIANYLHSTVQKFTKRKLHDDFSLIIVKL